MRGTIVGLIPALIQFAWTSLALPSANVQADVQPVRSTPSLIPNWGFESGSINPWSAYGGTHNNPQEPVASVVSPGFDSDHAAQLKIWVRGFLSLSNRPIQQGTNYSISVEYKILHASPGCIFLLQADDDDIDYVIWNRTATADNRWKTAHIYYPNFASTHFGIHFGVQCKKNDDTAMFQVDDVKMEAIGSTVTEHCTGDARLVNGGFESGQLAPWYSPDPFSGDGQGRTGRWVRPGYKSAQAMEIDFAASTQLMGWNFRQTLSNVCYPKKYEYSFAVNWVNYTGPATGQGSCQLDVEAFDCDSHSHISQPKAGWHVYSFTCQAKRDTIDLSVIMSCYAPSSDVRLQLDSFAIQRLGASSSHTAYAIEASTSTPM